VSPPEEIRALVDGIEARGVLPGCDALLSGYIGEVGTGAVLLHAAARVKAANPRALWCCDPVIGDDKPGVYVRPGIAEFFASQAVAQADVLTPNQFELGCLTGLPCHRLDLARHAIGALRARMPPGGPRAVLVTSFAGAETPDDTVDLLCGAGSGCFRLRVPKLPLAVNGAGDTIAALFLFHLLHTGQPASAMENAASAVHSLLMRTMEADSRELLTVAAQEEFVNPSMRFAAEML
jgi:pyridoxine kinase